METFAYAHPATKQEVFGLLGNSWTDAAVLAGGTDIISLMKEHVVIPQRVVSIRGIKEWGGISQTPAGLRIGALVTFEELRENVSGSRAISFAGKCGGWHWQSADAEYGHGSRRFVPAAALLVFPEWIWFAGARREREFAGARRRKSLPRHFWK